MLTEAQRGAIQAIIDSAKAKLKPAPEVKKPQTASSLFGASSGVASGGTAESKTVADTAVAAALANASPAEIMAAWKAANTGGNPDEANRQFIDYFSASRKL